MSIIDILLKRTTTKEASIALLASSIQYTTARAPTCIYLLVELIRAFLFCLSVLLFASMAAAAAATLLLRSIPHISRKQSERREVRVCPLCVSIADATIGRLLHEVSVAGDGRASALGSPPFSFPNKLFLLLLDLVALRLNDSTTLHVISLGHQGTIAQRNALFDLYVRGGASSLRTFLE